MLNMAEVIDELSTVFDKSVAEKLGQVMLSVYERLHESTVLQRLELIERRLEEREAEWQRALQELTAQLAAVRIETEARFGELAVAQRASQEQLQLLTERMEQLTAHVDQLTERMEQLTEAQLRSEQRIERLAEVTLRLAETDRDIQKQLGGLSQTVGYVLENEAMKKLPELLHRDYGLQVEGRLRRQYVQDRHGRHIEVNVFGTARSDGDTVTIVGESKSQLSKNDIDRFLARTVRELEGSYPKLFPVLITHMISEPDAEEYARELGVALYYSYEF